MRTIAMLSENAGPIADLIVDDALRRAKLAQADIVTSRHSLHFLKALKQELPAEVDKEALTAQLWREPAQAYLFD